MHGNRLMLRLVISMLVIICIGLTAGCSVLQPGSPTSNENEAITEAIDKSAGAGNDIEGVAESNNPGEIQVSQKTGDMTAGQEAGDVKVKQAKPLEEGDFTVVYKGFNINEYMVISDLNDNLGFGEYVLISEYNNAKRWTRIYPGDGSIDIRLEFISKGTKDYIVSAELLTIPTIRGIAVGDSRDKLIEVYGEPVPSKSSGETGYSLEYSLGSRSILFDIDNTTSTITRVLIDYNLDMSIADQLGKSMEDNSADVISIDEAEKAVEDLCRKPDIDVHAYHNEKFDIVIDGVKYYYVDVLYGLLMLKKPVLGDDEIYKVFVSSEDKSIYEVVEDSDGKLTIGNKLKD